MANIDITQLEQKRSRNRCSNGADAELIAITSPKETQCSPDCRELLVGQATTFEVFIQNTSQDISELGYSTSLDF